jgi:hypothetical protein
VVSRVRRLVRRARDMPRGNETLPALARSSGLTVGPAMAAFLRDLETSLRRAPAPSVAVLTGDNASTLPALLTAAFPAATVSTHRTALG